MDAVDRIGPPVRPGERLVVRFRLPDGSATDVIGWLEQLSGDRLELIDHAGQRVAVDRSVIVAARRLPPARGGRDPMRTSAADLERVALTGWLADREQLGEWSLRAGGGFTARANSCLAVGDPGLSVAEAARRIVDFARTRGTLPWAQVVIESAEDRALRELGWTEVHQRTDVLVARLAALLDNAGPDPGIVLSEDLAPEWERAFRLSRPSTAAPEVVRRILDQGRPRAFAGATRDGQLIAIGRGHVADDWLGVAALWTAPEHRRLGWAGRLLIGLGHWGARRGARQVYLQVAAENEAALRAYERLGFRRHHGYRYLSAPADGSLG